MMKPTVKPSIKFFSAKFEMEDYQITSLSSKIVAVNCRVGPNLELNNVIANFHLYKEIKRHKKAPSLRNLRNLRHQKKKKRQTSDFKTLTEIVFQSSTILLLLLN